MKDYRIMNILVPVDLSETSLRALQAAISIAKTREASIHLLYVKERTPVKSALRPTKDIFNALMNNIKKNDKIKCSFSEVEGNVAEQIACVASEEDADLVMMGTHGASGYRDGYIGTNTYNCFKHCSCPVMSLPFEISVSGFRRILYPIRPSLAEKIRLSLLSEFVTDGCKLEILGLSLSEMERGTTILEKITAPAKEGLKEYATDISIKWANGESIAGDILRHAQASPPDLVMITPAMEQVSKQNFISPPIQKLLHSSKFATLFCRS
jgi:nucleotide-binding universal stress UspA family protein